MRHSINYILSVVVLLLVLSTGNVIAQPVTSATISGSVVDQNGNALFAATVIAKHEPSGTIYGTNTREDGRFNLLGLRTGGPYTVKVTNIGYRSIEQNNYYLELSQNLNVEYRMFSEDVQLGEVVISSDRNAILSGNRTGASQFVGAENIRALPTIERRFQDFSKLSPFFSGTNLGAAGRNNRYNNIQIDGASYNDLFGLGTTGTPGGQASTNPISLDAIEEFQVVVAPFDVRMSNFTGGGINAITRSGTNKYEGSVYGFGRNQSLVGKSPDALKTPYQDFYEYQAGFRIGGPIIKDELFFFVNAEQSLRSEPLANSSLGTANAATYRAYADSVRNILSAKGMDAGTYGESDIERPSLKLFARLDYNLSRDHKLTLRHNFVDASDDILALRTNNQRISFSSYAYRFNTTTNSTALQLSSRFGDNMSNELTIGYTRIRDTRAGITDNRPEIEVRFDNGNFRVIAGPDRFSSANELDQDVFEFTNNFTYLMGDHVFTAGTNNEFFSFRNLFVRSFYGYYVFNNGASQLNSGVASSFERSAARTNPGASNRPAAEFDAMRLGFYVQDEWAVLPNLKLTLGVRVDIPMFPTDPAANDSVSKYFPGYSTGTVPKSAPLFSPRVGFNYDVDGRRGVQVRGGVGVFTGRIPYVWISNNYGNTGTLITDLRGTNTTLSLDPNNQPTGSSASFTSEINMISEDFKMPQVLRGNIGIDYALPMDFVATAEFMYTKSLNDLYYKKLNYTAVNANRTAASAEGRTILNGSYDSKGNNFTNVLLLENTDLGYTYNISIQVQRNVARGLSVNTGYTYGRAEDANSVNSSQALSQMRYNPIFNDANTPVLGTSQHEVKHRTFFSVSYTEEFLQGAPTTVSLYYNGQTGSPFSFIVNGDVNGDGYTDNDLFYIPKNATDAAEIQIGSLPGGNGTAFVANATMASALEAYILNNDYLKENRGQVSKRGGAYNPWRDIVDLRIAQVLPLVEGHKIELTLDVLNVLNLLNSDWGYNQSIFSTSQIVSLVGYASNNKPVYSFSKPANNVPWTAESLTSRWAMQLGVRYTF